MALLWFQFLASALVVVVAGIGLVRFSDVIAEKGPWAACGSARSFWPATSLRIATSISAADGLSDIAIGNVYGNNTFNIFILAIVDMLEGRGSICAKCRQGTFVGGIRHAADAIGALSIVARCPIACWAWASTRC